jgi:hypothetical protein
MDKMLSRALREFLTGLLNQLIVNLGGEDGDIWEKELKLFLRKEPCWVEAKKVVQRVYKILKPVGTTTISATTQPFVVREKFDKGNLVVKIGKLDAVFIGEFLCKIEDPIGGQILQYHELLKSATDLPKKPGEQAIITELGGSEVVETTMTGIYQLMVRHANGERGVLLDNGQANMFYVKNAFGVFGAVSIHLTNDGWLVVANSVKDPHEWRANRRVFSGNNKVLEHT